VLVERQPHAVVVVGLPRSAQVLGAKHGGLLCVVVCVVGVGVAGGGGSCVCVCVCACVHTTWVGWVCDSVLEARRGRAWVAAAASASLHGTHTPRRRPGTTTHTHLARGCQEFLHLLQQRELGGRGRQLRQRQAAGQEGGQLGLQQRGALLCCFDCLCVGVGWLREGWGTGSECRGAQAQLPAVHARGTAITAGAVPCDTLWHARPPPHRHTTP
jgi:hypothetical protein